MGIFDLVALLIVPEALVVCVVGVLAAVLVHWFAPLPEPVILEALLVAGGFMGGLVVSWLSGRRRSDSREHE